ncbi:MAG: thioredoxin domain-containing protein [Thermoproteota archaeon]|nr:thioredoxin domain-containing protein [Thermoproteota archaeon]
MNEHNNKLKPNSLINESSPYLLQHAYNPVNWLAWNDEAINLSRKEDKPIFLSIGYSSCHWCHVMAHESFEDNEIAKIMNEKFINIKVDREERPDIDDIYQRACQLVTGNGGWPLSVFLTPDLKPFYVGTYFPKESRYGIPGFGEILNQLSQAYSIKKNDINKTTSEFVQALVNTSKDITTSKNNIIDKTVLDESALNLLQMADFVYGGFGSSPKFPNVSNLIFLLRYYHISEIEKFRDFVTLTCDKMIFGGIHDHLGGGFSRYSTDQKWLVPHFEKMLYDNALLVILFCEMYQISRDAIFRDTVEKTLDYILRDLTSNEGVFYSAEDADSEGEEGKFYVWSKKEIISEIKIPLHQDIFCEYFGITEMGNFEGKNILNVKYSLDQLARKYGLESKEIKNIIELNSAKLFTVREKRVRPQKDDKTILSWNALAISAFVKGFKITGKEKYLEAALNAVEFIETKLKSKDGYLYRIYKKGEAKIPAYLDDYSFYINALLDIFEVKTDSKCIKLASHYADLSLKHFWDIEDNNFYYSSDMHESLLLRTKILYDLALPSGNSVFVSNLIRLYHIIGNNDYMDRAERMIKGSISSAIDNPFGFGWLLTSSYLYIKKPIEITVFSKDTKYSKIIDELNKMFIPNGIFAILNIEDLSQDLDRYSLFKNKTLIKEKPKSDFVLICKDFTCTPPIISIEEIKEILASDTSKERIK